MAFRRRSRRGDDRAAVALGASGRPLVTVTSLDGVPDEIDAQAPLDGELVRVIPGPDRPDYCLVILDRPLRFHPGTDLDLERVLAEQLTTEADGRPLLWVRTVVVVARFAGERITPGVRDLTVDLALVVDDTTLRDDVLDFAKVLPIGVGTFGHRAAPTAPSPPPAPPPRGMSTQDVYAIFVCIAQTLRDDLETARGAPVERLDVSIAFDERQRIDTVIGTADGLPALPLPAAFERMNAAAGELLALAPRHRPGRLGIHVDGTRVSFDVAYRQV